jgi:D-sedoheptulose 7-phosphate isomerase
MLYSPRAWRKLESMSTPSEAGHSPSTVVQRRLEEHLQVVHGLAALSGAIAVVAEMIIRSIRSGGKVIVFGNGGSAADAQHMAAELVGRYSLERRALPAIALTTDTSNLTAVSNDYGYAEVFVRQIEALGRAGDVAIGITTSGRSENVLRALKGAHAAGLVTVCLTGQRGVAMGQVDVELRVPSSSTPRIQEAHITMLHCICELVERELAGA